MEKGIGEFPHRRTHDIGLVNEVGYEILTPNGFRSFEGLRSSVVDITYQVIGANGKSLRCTGDHPVLTRRGLILTHALCVGDSLLTDDGDTIIERIDVVNESVSVFDPIEVDDPSHLFYANGFVNRQCLLLDEFAFIPENIANEFYASTFPTISSGKTTKIIMVSTPNGMNLFHKFWVDAKSGDNDFVPIFAHWSQTPGRGEQWRLDTIRNIGGPEKFAAEYECVGPDTMITVKDMFTGSITMLNISDLYEHLTASEILHLQAPSF